MRKWGQLVSLMLALVCLLNAQCLFACAPVSAEHACCPHHRGAPCTQTISHADDTQIILPPAPVVAHIEPMGAWIPPQLRSIASPISAAEFPKPTVPSSIPILRI